MTSVPLTAWEQAAVVCVFGSVFLGLVYALTKAVLSILKWFGDQQKDWQKFIAEQNAQWQLYNSKREEQFSVRNDSVVHAMEALAERVSTLITKTDEHHDETSQAIATMKERTASRDASKPTPTQRARVTPKKVE